MMGVSQLQHGVSMGCAIAAICAQRPGSLNPWRKGKFEALPGSLKLTQLGITHFWMFFRSGNKTWNMWTIDDCMLGLTTPKKAVIQYDQKDWRDIAIT